MLQSTKLYNDILKETGLKKKDYRVRTEEDHKRGGWQETRIIVWDRKKLTEDVINKITSSGEIHITKLIKDGKLIDYLIRPQRYDDKEIISEWHI